MAHSVHTWFSDKENKATLSRLLTHIVVEKTETPRGGVFQGQSIVVTGTLPTLSRDEAYARIRKEGGSPASSVSSKTSFVLAGESAGSKHTKAQDLGVPIISEQEFLKRLSA